MDARIMRQSVRVKRAGRNRFIVAGFIVVVVGRCASCKRVAVCGRHMMYNGGRSAKEFRQGGEPSDWKIG